MLRYRGETFGTISLRKWSNQPATPAADGSVRVNRVKAAATLAPTTKVPLHPIALVGCIVENVEAGTPATSRRNWSWTSPGIADDGGQRDYSRGN
jgi:hypothetical protein